MKLVKTAVCALALVAASMARADSCEDTFVARLAETKRAVAARSAYIRENRAKFAAAEWFNDHCRFLTELELAIRKIDDPNAFVCDPKAKGRPKGLTGDLVLEFGGGWPDEEAFLEEPTLSANRECAESDRASRLALFWPGSSIDDDLNDLELYCYGDDREKCVKARAMIAAARAKKASAGAASPRP